MKVRILMRKHCARKWLHFTIDLLPFVVIPIFAIWQINHSDNQPISVEVENRQVVDFNQLRSSLSVPSSMSEYVTINDNVSLTINGTFTGRKVFGYTNSIDFVVNHKYLIKGVGNFTPHTANWSISFVNDGNDTRIATCSVSTSGVLNLELLSGTYTYDYDSFNVSVFDLTQMFGSGNEPTVDEFNDIFTDYYYQPVSSKRVLVSYGTVTYDNTDVGSQFLYSVYKPVQEYFNFDNIFNFGALRNWFELNFFNGNMGIPMTIIWNVIIYEFLSDIIMLIYTFFMFIIDFANDLLERPFSDINRG